MIEDHQNSREERSVAGIVGTLFAGYSVYMHQVL